LFLKSKEILLFEIVYYVEELVCRKDLFVFLLYSLERESVNGRRGGFGYVFMVWLIGNAVLKVISICIQKTFDAAWLHSENRRFN
jgi:hypothetical protein